MRLVKASRKWTPVLVMGCVVLLSTLYIIDLGSNSYCAHRNDTSRRRQVDKRPARDFQDHRMTSYENSRVNNRPISFDNSKLRESDFHEYLQSQSIKYDATEFLRNITRSELEIKTFLTTKMPNLHPKIEASSRDDVLRNVSFADLMHVVDNNDLNTTMFLNWTKTYKAENKKRSFELPPLVERGSRVCDNNTDMIILIPAAPDEVMVREVVRQTWASSLYGVRFPQMRSNSLRIKIAFTFGTNGLTDVVKMAIKREAWRYNDIVTADFIDSYRNLSLKMMVSLNWISDFCSSVKYVMKADLDTFVNIPLLSRFLQEISKTVPQYILGHKHPWRQPPVLRSGKWKVNRKDYPFEMFPPYVYGHSYVITADLVPLLVSVGKTLPLLPTEDAHITGVLAQVIRAPRIHYRGFASKSKKSISCIVVYNYDMSVTKMSPGRLLLMWRDVLTNVCSEIEPPKSETVIQWEFTSLMNEIKDELISRIAV